MINDLDIKSPLLWIFVDDTTASEVIQKGNACSTQGITNELIEWPRKNRVVLNPDKCKELRISFSQNPEAFDTVSINGNEIEVVNSAKLLGITISDNLTWNAHINEDVKKASKKLYFPIQLKRARLPPSDRIYSRLRISGVLQHASAVP